MRHHGGALPGHRERQARPVGLHPDAHEPPLRCVARRTALRRRTQDERLLPHAPRPRHRGRAPQGLQICLARLRIQEPQGRPLYRGDQSAPRRQPLHSQLPRRPGIQLYPRGTHGDNDRRQDTHARAGRQHLFRRHPSPLHESHTSVRQKTTGSTCISRYPRISISPTT